jgi:hypothetical protein
MYKWNQDLRPAIRSFKIDTEAEAIKQSKIRVRTDNPRSQRSLNPAELAGLCPRPPRERVWNDFDHKFPLDVEIDKILSRKLEDPGDIFIEVRNRTKD